MNCPCPALAWHDSFPLPKQSMNMVRFSFLILLVVCPPLLAAPVDFDREVRPIFDAHCVACHGPEKQKSGYRLDSREAALAGGESGEPAIVPGQPEAGKLIHFVDGSDKELFMPPRKSDAKALSTAQIATLRQWIAEGAKWSEAVAEKKISVAEPTKHWSFQPLKRPAVPGSEANAIDAFIHAKLRERGLAASPEAERRTLIRRVSFDLTGLPPTAEEVDAFCADGDPNAYDKLVDRLLASPRYGERWARHWLDVVHYGETHGYDKDKPRNNAWPYRDYVIRAFNDDKPYARFVQEQIAGDVLFPDTVDGITALGFISAGPWDFIGHAEVPETKIDGKIARHLDRDDMVSNTINTFQSVTVHCAQCHDHKFDPIKQEDYYSLQADFAALDRADKPYFADAALTKRYATLQFEKRRLDARMKSFNDEAVKAAGDRLVKLDQRIDTATKSLKGNTVPQFGYHSAISPKQDAVKWVQVDLGRSVEIDKIVLLPAYDDFGGIGAGFGFPVRFKVEVSEEPEFRQGAALVWRRHDETFMRDFANPGVAPFTTGGAKGDFQARYVRVTATKLAKRSNDYILALAEIRVLDGSGKNLALGTKVTALDSIEAAPRWAAANLVDGHTPEPPDPSAGDLAGLRAERTKLLEDSLTESKRKERTDTTEALKRVTDELGKFPKPQMVYAGIVHYGSGSFSGTGPNGGKPRPIALLARGDVKRPGKEVSPGALSFLSPLPARFDLKPEADEGERRAALARWLSDERNPLTWRSIVNRMWQYHFGRGIVETPNDFGKMGTPPTHPELLDWLAVWFRDDAKGSLKALHKLIVTSETYRQTAVPDAALMKRASEIDGSNTLLWRQNRRRLEAEAIRDSILAAAGKLDLTMGGPSFQDFVITHPEHSPHYEYHLADPEDPKIQRRSIYRFIVRSQQQPWMTTMDCADPSMLVERRNQTITPLQALAQLNNQLGLAMSKHFAERVAKQDTDPAAQISDAFRIALQRTPTDAERDELVPYARKHGLVNVCRLLLNLNEFVFVD
jgi:mono/diheme cytochrome c family protein